MKKLLVGGGIILFFAPVVLVGCVAVMIPAVIASGGGNGCLNGDATLVADANIPAEYRPLVEQAAAEAGIPAGLLAALAWKESTWNPQAISPSGAQGLTQLLPATGRSVGVTDPFDPADNLRGGARYLRQQIDAFANRGAEQIDYALAAYNAGPNRAGKGRPWPAQTEAYVPAVKAQAAKYSAEATVQPAIYRPDTPPASGTLGPPSTRSYSQTRLTPNALRLADAVRAFGFDGTIGGWRPSARDPNGHPSGRAVDLMVPDNPTGKQTGDRLVAFLTANHAALGVDYIIWYQQIGQAPEFNWRPMTSRGSRTADHYDHPHVSVLPGDTGVPAATIVGNAGVTTPCPTLVADGATGPSGTGAGGIPPLVAPTPGARFTSEFGPRVHPISGQRRLHAGVDFGVPTGTPVHAMAAGRIASYGSVGGYGNLLTIDHGNGITSRYAHLSARIAAVGQIVTAGTPVALSGNTGASTGAHLHAEIRVNGDAVDPCPTLPAGTCSR